MEEQEIEKKIDDLEKRILELENSKSIVKYSFEFVDIFQIDEQENRIFIADNSEFFNEFKSNRPIIVTDGGLQHGNTGPFKWENFNQLLGRAKLIHPITRKDLMCKRTLSGISKGRTLRYPNKGTWNIPTKNMSWSSHQIGRVGAPHSPFAVWSKFETVNYGNWIAHFVYG